MNLQVIVRTAAAAVQAAVRRVTNLKLDVGVAHDFGYEEQEEMYNLLARAGTVSTEGLLHRIEKAAALAILSDGDSGEIVGCMGLKNPESSYKERISNAAQYSLHTCQYELGWAVLKPEAQGQGAAQAMGEQLLSYAHGTPVYAVVGDGITQEQAEALDTLGFRRVGLTFVSDLNGRPLALWVQF